MINKIKEILNEGVIKGDFPGGQFCLIEDGKVSCDYVGYKVLYPEKIATNEKVVYDVASLSKVVSTTTLIFNLIDNNKLTLDTKVKDILPKYKHETKVKELLLHTSGLRPIIANNDKVKTKEDLINQIYNEELIYEPYTKIAYSDTGFMLLGFIIEKLNNMSIDKVAEKIFIKPLNMEQTTYNPTEKQTATTEYDKTLNDYVNGFVHDERSRLLKGLSGHAGLFSTAKDLSKFMYSFLYDEKVMSNKSKNLIYETIYNKPSLNNNELIRTYGFEKFDKNNYFITHTGFTGCNMWIDNKNKRAFVLLTNAVHPKREENKIFDYRKAIYNLFY